MAFKKSMEFEVEVKAKNTKESMKKLSKILKKATLYVNIKEKKIEWNNWTDPGSDVKVVDYIQGKKYVYRIRLEDSPMITSAKKNLKKEMDVVLEQRR